MYIINSLQELPEQIKPDTIINGDCLLAMRAIADHSVDLVLCDLPYGTTGCFWDNIIPFDKLWVEYKRVLKKDGTVVLFGNQPFTSHLICSNSKWYKYNWVWQKSTKTGHMNAKLRPLKETEDICIFSPKRPRYNPQGLIDAGSPKDPSNRNRILNKERSKWMDINRNTYEDNLQHKGKEINYHMVPSSVCGHGDPKQWYDNEGKIITKNKDSINKAADTQRKGKTYIQQWTNYPTNILRFKNDYGKNVFHPTQKPIALLRYLIKTYTNPGEVVLDNTMGVGSTGVACIMEDRRFIGMELETRYFEIGKERIEKAILEFKPVEVLGVEEPVGWKREYRRNIGKMEDDRPYSEEQKVRNEEKKQKKQNNEQT